MEGPLTDWSEYDEPPDWEALESEALESPDLIDPAWRPLDTAAIFDEPLPDFPMLVPALDLGAGRPCGLVGGPGSGKTLTAIAVAIGVMTGRPIFGELAVGDRGRVVHITYDMGRRAVALRYRQIANGLGVSPEEIRGRLIVAAHPRIYLNSEGAFPAIAKLLDGAALCILDNARDSAPGADENESTFGALLTGFGGACEAAGCVGLYLHHTKKGSGEELVSGSLRGSSAILAASGSIWGLEGEGDEERVLRHLRPHDMSDGLLEPLTLLVEKGNRGAFSVPGDRTKALSFKIAYRERNSEVVAASGEELLRLEIEAAVSADPKITVRALLERLKSIGLGGKTERVSELLRDEKERRGIA